VLASAALYHDPFRLKLQPDVSKAWNSLSISLEGLWADADSEAKLESTSALNFICEALTPELSRAAQRPRRWDDHSASAEAAKRTRLERIVSPQTCFVD
jgi:hypothetical protein